MDIDRDLAPFGAMLDAVCSLLSRGAYAPSDVSTALFFRALQAYPLDRVRGAFDAHVRDPERGRFVPTPADILAHLQGAEAMDGRPGVEEAWSIAVTGIDEATSIVWTDEIRRAWAVALPVMRLGDEIGARMAFREAYGRLVGEARQSRAPVAWSLSLGHDPEQRAAAVRQAVELGRLPQSSVEALLPAPRGAVPLLDGPAATTDAVRAAALARLRGMRDTLIGPAQATRVDRTPELRRAAAERASAYQGAAA